MKWDRNRAHVLVIAAFLSVSFAGCPKSERLPEPHTEEDTSLTDTAVPDAPPEDTPLDDYGDEGAAEVETELDQETGDVEDDCDGPREQFVDGECVCDPDYHRDADSGECFRCLNNSHCGDLVCVANTCRPCITSDECGERYCGFDGYCQDGPEACETDGDMRCSNHMVQNCEDGFWANNALACPFGCNTETNECYTDTNVGWIGGRCVTVGDCHYLASSTAQCLAGDEGFLNGYCTQRCTGACPNREDPGYSYTFCVDSVGVNDAGICATVCDYERYSDTGCRTGYECRVVTRYDDPVAYSEVCLPINWWRDPTRGFDYGIASGDIESTSAVVWAQAGSAPTDVVVEYGEDPARLERRITAGRTIRENNYTIQVALPGLTADTEYYYRFVLQDGLGTSPLGSFRTAPRPEQSVPLSFVFSGDVVPRYWEEDPWLVADPFDIFNFMELHDPDLFLSLGGWPNATTATSRWGYHTIHQLTRDRESVWKLLQGTPIYAVLGDDEVHNDWDSTYATNNAFEVANGLEVWSDWFPLSEQAEGEYYRRFRWGALEFFLLDTRTHRDPSLKYDDHRKTMLGEEQLQWLLTGLRGSEAQFKFVVTSVPLDLTTNSYDGWTSYSYERDLILNTILCPAGVDVECDGLIENVIFLSSDELWFGAKHYNSGLKEFQTGPLTRATAVPVSDEAVIASSHDNNYGRFEYDPAGGGRLIFEAWDVESVTRRDERTMLLYREVIRPGHGQIEVTTVPEVSAKFRVCEPTDLISCDGGEAETCAHTFIGVAPATFTYAVPGPYRIHWYPVGGYATPEPEDLCLDDGETIRFTAQYDVVPLPWHDDFEVRSGWLIIDDGDRAGPSQWSWIESQLFQGSNIYDGSADDDLVRLGTIVWNGNTSWDDYTVSVDFFSRDDDGVGLVARFQDSEHYYRFDLDSQRTFARLVKRDGDQFTALAADEELLPYSVNTWTKMAVRVTGNTIEGLIDDTVVLTATDDDPYTTGAVGIYAWANDNLTFDDFHVE